MRSLILWVDDTHFGVNGEYLFAQQWVTRSQTSIFYSQSEQYTLLLVWTASRSYLSKNTFCLLVPFPKITFHWIWIHHRAIIWRDMKWETKPQTLMYNWMYFSKKKRWHQEPTFFILLTPSQKWKMKWRTYKWTISEYIFL